jgi:hypothetical protein
MQELIDVIRAAIATDSNKEQKGAGVQACRTIIAALDTEPGKPLVLPGIPPTSPLSGVSLDQVLDLMIGRLTVIASARETQSKGGLPPRDAAALPVQSRTGLRVPTATIPLARPAAIPRPAKIALPQRTKAQVPTRKP